MYFNARERKIIDFLILYGETAIADLIDYFKISERTLRRDISSINESFKSYKLEVIIKNSYIYLIGSNKNKNKVYQILEAENDLSGIELKTLILYKIFYSDNTSILEISNSTGYSLYTLNKTLEEIREENTTPINFISEKGKGLKTDLNESHKRKILHKYISLLSSDYLSNFMQGFNSEDLVINNGILNEVIDLNLVYRIEKIIFNHIIKNNKRKIIDDIYLSLVLMVAISLHRIKNRFYITDEINYENVTSENELEPMISELLNLITEEPSVLSGERYYLLKNFIILVNENNQSINYKNVVDVLISEVEEYYGIKLKSKVLREDLIQHFKNSNSNQIVGNTYYTKKLISQIKDEYFELYKVIESKMVDLVGEDNITDEQIVFVVLHFGVELIELNVDIKHQKRILAVCSSGMGSSKMMASILKAKLDNVIIHSTSIYKLYNQTDISLYDLIVTTVNLNGVEIPYVVVSPLITDNQIRIIKKKLDTKEGVE